MGRWIPGIPLRSRAGFCRLLFLVLMVACSNSLFPTQAVFAIPIGYGDCILDSLTPAGDKDTLTFDANSGDVVIVRMARMSGDIAVRIEVYDSAWSLLADEWGFAYVAVDTLPLSSTGQHHIVASDYTGFGTGPYGLSLQRTFAPGGASPVSYGTTVIDSVTLVTEMNAYTFTADSGDVVTARMSWASGSLLPYLRIFDPSGEMVAEDVSYPKPMVDTLAIGQTGTYTVIACDQYGPWFGSYGLSLQRTFDPPGADTIAYYQVVQDSITRVSQLRAYVFYGTVFEWVVALMSEPSGGLTPYLELYSPSGQKLSEDWGTLEAGVMSMVGTTGWHTLLASDHTGPDTGNFRLEIMTVGVAEQRVISTPDVSSVLLEAAPNPFNRSTMIQYVLPVGGEALVRICDVTGRTVSTLASGWHKPGKHALRWQARDEDGQVVPNGIYLCTVEYGGSSESARLVHLR